MAVFRQRRGTAAALAAANETPAAGQIYFELDANRVKIGNGTTRYNDLPYLDAKTVSQIEGLQSALDSKSNVGHTHALNDLSDVSASSSFDNPLLDNYILTYDQATGTWRHTNKGGYVPVGSIPLGVYPSGTIGAALAGKVNATDARLTDQRVPIDGSVTTNKLSDDNLTLDGGNF